MNETLTTNDVAALKKLAESVDSNTRYYVAWNENTPTSVLEFLEIDEDEHVSRAAHQALSRRDFR